MRYSGLVPAIVLAASSGGAFAADLPVKAAQAAYVKQCTAIGAGFYYVPGTDTCLRIGGYVRAEAYFNTYTDYPIENDKTYSIGLYGLIVDARTNTEYGVLRSYMDMRFLWRTANPWSDGPNRSQVVPWNIYIQFAGFTFGYAQSFFDFYANANVLGTDPGTIGDDTRLPLLAYTWEFANGWAATVSFEDANIRNSGIYAADPTLPDISDDYQSGARLPDFVANFGQTGDWGQAQLSGALHQVVGMTPLTAGAPYIGATTTDEWGYAVQAGLMFNLPFIAEGDSLYLQSAYVNGAVAYLGLINASGAFAPPDAFIGANGSLSKVTGWNFTSQFLHNWNDKWQSAFFGGYAKFDLDDPIAQAGYGASAGVNYNLGGNLTWTPVNNLAITLQYDYNMYKANNYVDTGLGLPTASQAAHQVLFMVERDF
ncbi:porin [Aquabacter spiritensis]|uniref:Porin n=1 Tax=Aquabacter spiritensis TaxID=933073 RepID=A0A4R3LVL0_9HYPH|nr:porin [Aquabacter spiritensis]TCT04621.1 porin-like protein [Aquabacter spiritensis]